MRAVLLLFTLALAGCGSTTNAGPAAVDAALASTTLRVDGMTCASCEVSIRVAAEKLDGVQAAKVDFDTGAATVQYDPARVAPTQIAEAITALGYPATVEGSSSAALLSDG